MEHRLKDVLLALGYEQAEVQLEQAEGGKVGGVLVSERFKGKSQEQRQNELWAELEKKLNAEELTQIVAIMTMTPEEIAA
jgi:acid stress-induced BolA-like protein IbaG/YrbA